MNHQTRSIFSVNTNQTGFHKQNNSHHNSMSDNMGGQGEQANKLHEYYYKLLPTFSKECPYFAKLFFLQLTLRENIMLFTQCQVDARDIWLSLSRILQLKKPEIYVIDEKFNVNDILTTKNQYQRVMLFDVSKLTIDAVNGLLNSDQGISIMGIESQKCSISQHVIDFFAMIATISQDQQAANLVQTYNQQISLNSMRDFDKKSFNECVKQNFQIVLQHQSEDEGFLKPFLDLLQYKLDKVNIKIAQSKWKKMLRILKFIGVNKNEGTYKRLMLGDFVLCSELLSSSVQQLFAIKEVLFSALKMFVPYYGLHKFEKSIKNHFWFSKTHVQYSKRIMDTLNNNSISFFYPCQKFPQTANVRVCQLQQQFGLCYAISGYEKKLMSDHHYEVSPQIQANQYTLSLDIKADSKMVIHVGIACYDKIKGQIQSVQACRKQNSEVVYHRIQGDKLIVNKSANLANWNSSKQNYAYERAIGIYFTGQINEAPPLSQILFSQSEPYSTKNRPYQQIHNGQDSSFIHLSQQSRHWFVNYKHLLHKDKTVLMNHYEGGVGCIGQSLRLQKDQWKKVQIQYQGIKWQNSGNNFFPGTKFIRVVLMVNYSEGHPNFEIQNKNASFYFKDISFTHKA